MKPTPDANEGNAQQPEDASLWGETMINEVIHEANRLQRDPESFIKEKKEGADGPPQREFRTIYRREQPPGFLRRWLDKLRRRTP